MQQRVNFFSSFIRTNWNCEFRNRTKMKSEFVPLLPSGASNVGVAVSAPVGSWNPRWRTPEPEVQPTFDQRWEGGVRASFPKSQHDFICLGSCCEEHALLEGGGGHLCSPFQSQKAKRQRTKQLCVERPAAR